MLPKNNLAEIQHYISTKNRKEIIDMNTSNFTHEKKPQDNDKIVINNINSKYDLFNIPTTPTNKIIHNTNTKHQNNNMGIDNILNDIDLEAVFGNYSENTIINDNINSPINLSSLKKHNDTVNTINDNTNSPINLSALKKQYLDICSKWADTIIYSDTYNSLLLQKHYLENEINNIKLNNKLVSSDILKTINNISSLAKSTLDISEIHPNDNVNYSSINNNNLWNNNNNNNSSLIQPNDNNFEENSFFDDYYDSFDTNNSNEKSVFNNKKNNSVEFRDEDRIVLLDNYEASIKIMQKKWGLENFEWSKSLKELGLNIFGIHTFRTLQYEVMNASMSLKDCFVIMPTGGGKSLCYQLPALLSPGLTIVFSPLISLIHDQVSALKFRRIPAKALTSNTSSEESRALLHELHEGNITSCTLLYITPERFNISSRLRNIFSNLYSSYKLSRFVIDEAHCVSQWGHDFRPDYLKLKDLKSLYPKVPILACTATATPSVQKDVLRQLNLDDPEVFKTSFNRPNLFFEVRKKTTKDAFIQYIKDNFHHRCGIVYCNSRDQCEEVAKMLKKNGLSADYYHAGLSNENRESVQHLWSNDSVQIIVATNAFGMGINKPNVRFVVHYTFSKSLECLYQESGRAGRDGKKSHCIVFYKYADKRGIEFLIKQGLRERNISEELFQNELQKMNDVICYCENDVDCRRVLALRYFGESFDRANCADNCDNCLRNSKKNIISKNLTAHAQNLIRIVQDADKIHASDITCIFRGSRKGTYGDNPLFGIGGDVTMTVTTRLLHHLVVMGALKEDAIANSFGGSVIQYHIGPCYSEVLSGKKQVYLSVINSDKDKNKNKRERTKEKKEYNKEKVSKQQEKQENSPQNESRFDIYDVDDDKILLEQANNIIQDDANFYCTPLEQISDNDILIEKLQKALSEFARTQNMKTWGSLLPSDALVQIVQKSPSTIKELESISGIDSHIAVALADIILPIIKDHVNNH